MTKSALVILGTGFEELEAVAPIDILRRAGVAVTVASCAATLTVEGRNAIRVVADVPLAEVVDQTFDAVVVPGGPGVAALREDARVRTLLQRHAAAGKLLAAICAAPLVLADAGILQGRRYTGHASIATTLPALEPHAVVLDGPVLTSRGAGTSVPFALALVSALSGARCADEIAAAIHHPPAF